MCPQHPSAKMPSAPLAIKLRSGLVLTDPSAHWHIDLLVHAGIPEEQWDELVAESGFLDPQGTFVAGRGIRLLAGQRYFTGPPEGASHG